MQHRSNTGLNKGEIRDRSSEGQHYRMAGLSLLAAIVIYWIPPISTKRSDSGSTPGSRSSLNS